MEIAVSLWVQKYGAQTPDWAIILFFALGALPLLIAAIRYERFIAAGGRIKQQISIHPFSAALLCGLIWMILWSVDATLSKHFQKPPLLSQPSPPQVAAIPSLELNSKSQKPNYQGSLHPSTVSRLTPQPPTNLKSCPPATGICFVGNSGTVSDVYSIGSPNGIVVKGDKNQLHDAGALSGIEEYENSPKKTEALIAELSKEHDRKWKQLSQADREQKEKEAAKLEQEIREAEGDPSKVGSLLTKLWVME